MRPLRLHLVALAATLHLLTTTASSQDAVASIAPALPSPSRKRRRLDGVTVGLVGHGCGW